MTLSREDVARITSMPERSISHVFDVADGTLVVTEEGAQTLIVDGVCSAVYPRREVEHLVSAEFEETVEPEPIEAKAEAAKPVKTVPKKS